jgi:putative nucleotidyltransferase with HDIG domain
MKSEPRQTASDTNDVNKALERAKQELEQMIDLNPQGMMLATRAGEVVRANRALLEILGQNDFRPILGKRLEELFPCREATFFKRLLRATSGYEMGETPVGTKADGGRTFRFTVVNPGTKGDLFVMIVNDVTGEREKAKHLEKAYKQEAVRALMGALMHNINQPLTVILVRAHLLRMALEKSGQQSDELKKNIHDIVTLTLQISDTLKAIETPADFVTEPYTEGVDILDIKRSGGKDEKWKALCTHSLDFLLGILNTHEPGALLHARRTAEYAVHLARHMELDEKQVEIARQSALYHDIGKIGIPDSVLQKPAPLSPAERDIVNRHSEIGHHLVGCFPFLSDVAQAVHSHHEHYNGKGYPQGLAKEKIPLTARIVAVADTFDALRFYRFYHDPTPLENTVREIKAHTGTQFDPQVVDAFGRCYRDLDGLFPHTPLAERLS